MVAGAVISGAYFGDKLSPMSDTTNLAPAMAGTDFYPHQIYDLNDSNICYHNDPFHCTRIIS
jgi:NhaC family Na+:H+ antiporter